MFRYFVLIYTFSIFSIVGHAQEVTNSGSLAKSIYKNLELKTLCLTQAPKDNCPLQNLSQPIRLGIIACRAMVDSPFCQELVIKEPEFSQSLKRCRPDQYCEDYLFKELDSISSCKDGFLEGTGETFTALGDFASRSRDHAVDFLTAWIEKVQSNREQRDLFRKICDKDVRCKRSLVKDNPKFTNMSDESLNKYSTAILWIERDNYNYIKSTNLRHSILPKSMGERAEEQERRTSNQGQTLSQIREENQSSINAVREWLNYKGARLDCLDAKTQAELICWAASYIIDPLIVYGGTVKLARSSKFFVDLITKNAVKKEALEAVEITAVVEHRQTAAKVIEEGELVGTRIAAIESPNLPPSLKLAKYRSADGREYVAFEQAVKTPTGKIKTSIRELPIDPLTGAFDSNTPAGRIFLESILQQGNGKLTLAFFDVNNLGFINKNFARGSEAGDEFIKNVTNALTQATKGKAQLFRNGGDEFVLLIHETDPKKVKAILDEVYRTVNSKEVNITFREEKISRAQSFKAKQAAEAEAAEAIQSQLDFAKYSRAGVSAGSSAVGPGETLTTVLSRAEEQAKQAKIIIKEQMGIDTTKYGGKKPDSKARPNQTFVPEAMEPIPAPAQTDWTPKPKAPELSQSIGAVTETRKREVYRFGGTSIVEYENELGEIIIRQETYKHSATGATSSSTREIIVNQRTKMIEGSNQQGRGLLSRFVLSSSAEQQKALLRVDVSALGKVNYYQNGTQAGDALIKATSDVIRKECAIADIPFKMAGGEFVIGLDHTAKVNLDTLKLRIRNQIAKSDEVKKIFESQKEFLRSQIHGFQNNPQKIAELNEALAKVDEAASNFSLSTARVQPNESLEEILIRLRN